MSREGTRLRKLFGLEEPKRSTPDRPGHSMTGRVVTGEPVDWSRYDDCMDVSVVGESFYQDALRQVSQCPPSGPHGSDRARSKGRQTPTVEAVSSAAGHAASASGAWLRRPTAVSQCSASISIPIARRPRF